MDINYVAIIVVGLATLFVGYFYGLFEGRGNKNSDQGKLRAADEYAIGSQRKQPAQIKSG